MDLFLENMEEMRFLNIGELYTNRKIVKILYERLTLAEKEVYKWYFFYQLCLLKNPLKKIMWEYIIGKDVERELYEEYQKFCKKREKMYRTSNLTKK